MLRDITLGQYFPGDTPVHRLDPRTKIIAVTVYVVGLFMASGILDYVFCTAVLAAALAVSKINPGMILRGLKPIIFLIIFTAALNVFLTPGRVLWEFSIFRITEEGLITAATMAARIVLLIGGTSLLTYTTSPIMLTDAIESLMKPLAKIKVPVHELAMMMSIALRFIPTLIEETEKIMNAQKARGADFESGGVVARAKALTPVLIPLFVSAFRRADELATAMECRLYRGGEGRTRLRELAYAPRDYIAMAMCAAFIAVIVIL